MIVVTEKKIIKILSIFHHEFIRSLSGKRDMNNNLKNNVIIQKERWKFRIQVLYFFFFFFPRTTSENRLKVEIKKNISMHIYIFVGLIGLICLFMPFAKHH